MEPPENQEPSGRSLGRYVLYDEFAIGGMATVHFGRLRGQGGFSRTVAIKRLHPHLARDPHFVSLLVEEARLAARVQHPNVVAPLDVVAVDDCELLLVMEYIHGEALARLLGACARRAAGVPPPIASSVIAGVLYGLHAAHEAVSDDGEPLHIVHRDMSPQNILVGVDGAARVLDFGVAKATIRSHGTEPGVAKGKLSYMAPEQLRGKDVDRRADLFAVGVVLWEMLTLRRLFRSDGAGLAPAKILKGDVAAPSRFNPHVSPELDQVVAAALARHREVRYGTALEFAAALEQAVAPASTREVGQWVQSTAQESLSKRAQLRASIESSSLRESGSMKALSVASGTPAPEDESVTVRARPSQLRAAVRAEVVDGRARPLLAPPRPPPSVELHDLEPLSEEEFQQELQARFPAELAEEYQDPTEADARIPSQEPDSDDSEIERALAIFTPDERPAPLAMEPRPTPEPSVPRPAPSGVFEVLSMRSWFQVPTRVWGALGMTAFAAALALVIVLPSRSQPPPTRGRAPATAPQVEQLPPPAPPPVPMQTAPAVEPPAPEAARPRPAHNPVVQLEDEPLQLQPASFGKVHAAAPGRRRWRAKNRPADVADNAVSAVNCSPPYVLDERGIRRIRPECLAVP
jgi:serine/threonine protein kinase